MKILTPPPLPPQLNSIIDSTMALRQRVIHSRKKENRIHQILELIISNYLARPLKHSALYLIIN